MKSGKGKLKWGRAEHSRRLAFMRRIFAASHFQGNLRFSVYKKQVNYDMATIVSIAKALHVKEPPQGYTALIYVDGLTKTKRHAYGAELRKLGIPTKKMQGVTKDENNALTRLADALAGFVRDALYETGKEAQEIQNLFEEAVRKGVIVEV